MQTTEDSTSFDGSNTDEKTSKGVKLVSQDAPLIKRKHAPRKREVTQMSDVDKAELAALLKITEQKSESNTGVGILNGGASLEVLSNNKHEGDSGMSGKSLSSVQTVTKDTSNDQLTEGKSLSEKEDSDYHEWSTRLNSWRVMRRGERIRGG